MLSAVVHKAGDSCVPNQMIGIVLTPLLDMYRVQPVDVSYRRCDVRGSEVSKTV